MTAHFHNNLVFVLLQKLEIDFVWVGVPHGVVFIAGACIDMLDDNELAPFFSLTELL